MKSRYVTARSFAVGAAVLCMCIADASAKSKFIDYNAWDKCLNWCAAHNKTTASQVACRRNCTTYYETPDANGNYNTEVLADPNAVLPKAPSAAGALPQGGVRKN
jgi:hypothetical protein